MAMAFIFGLRTLNQSRKLQGMEIKRELEENRKAESTCKGRAKIERFWWKYNQASRLYA
jgi:Mn-dependent DtxR family transcriptional regulator